MRTRRTWGVVLALAATIAMVVTMMPLATFGADHLDAPALNPLAGTKRLDADINDLYVFQGADPNATVLAGTFSPAAGALGPSTFGTDVIYQFNLVDAPTGGPSAPFGFTADEAYRAIFDPPDSSGNQAFKLFKATDAQADGHSVASNPLIFSGMTNTIYDLPTGGKFFAGLRSDPFFFDLAGFQGSFGEQNNNRSLGDGNQADFFEDLNVLALVIEIPDDQLPDMDDDGFATWLSTGDLDSGAQLDRIGRPAINTVVNSTGSLINAPSGNKDLFNETHPADDKMFGQAVKDALAILSALDDEGAYDSSIIDSLTSALLPDKTFFNKQQSPFPPFNGRRLEDDVIDVELNILTGGPPFTVLGRDNKGAIETDGVGPHDDYLSVFPYLGEPHVTITPPPTPPPPGLFTGSLTIEKGPDATIVEGTNHVITIKVTNAGSGDLVNVRVTDNTHPQCSAVIGALEAGATAEYTCTITGTGPVITNTATVTGDLKGATTTLLGSNEVPSGSGDPQGVGSGALAFNPPDGRVCFNLALLNLQGTVSAAHVHQGASGVNGPVVVDLDFPANGLQGCAAATEAILQQILADLDAYYVNVHTDTHPAGAVRGQLQPFDADVQASDTATVNVVLPPPAPLPKPSTVGVIDQDQGLWYLVDPVLADLSGDNEVPSGSGDPDGKGRAQVTFNDLVDKICFNLVVEDLQSKVSAAHIHEGAKGVNGPVVVDLDFPNNGTSGCVDGIDQALIDAILADLDDYYVNVHTQNHPAGAVRGQLGGGPLPPFFFGNPGDDPFLGDWDGDGVDTPGMYRPSDGKVYLRNSNSPGIADIEFFFGDPGDVPLIGDWDGDGDDTVSVYRPSQGKFFIHNQLGSGNRGLGKAEIEFIFGDPFDDPFFGDFDGDGKDSVGVRRGNTFYWRNKLSSGPADNTGLRFGDPFDDPLFGDWDGDGLETPGLYRPSSGTLFLRNLREPGIADMEIFADGFESGDTSAWSR